MTVNWGNDGRLASRRLYKTSGGVNLSLLSYSYDNDDNITGITDGVTPANSISYAHDVRGRLNRVDLAATSAVPYKRTDYAHDANGNSTAVERRTNITDTVAAQTDSYAKTAGTNRLASITTASGIRSITPDARGNTASESRPGGITVSTGYDGHGRLISYGQSGTISLAHSYNGLGDRTATTATPSGSSADTRRFVTAPDGRIIGEYGTSATDVKAEFIWLSPEVGDTGPFGGGDGLGGYMPIALVTGTTLSWVHGDHLGTPIVMTDASGTSIAQPNGYTATAFPGQTKTLADLYYNRYRDYDPTTGRYIQADPIGLAGGSNPYSYAMGNPVRYIDPKGLHAETRPWSIPVPVFGPSEGDTQAAKQLGDTLGGFKDWVCRHSLICQYFNPPAEKSGSRYCPTPNANGCLPCRTITGRIVFVGTIAYRPMDTPTQPQHGIVGPHYNLYRANQNPNNCRCFWQSTGAVSPSGLPFGAIPIEPFS